MSRTLFLRQKVNRLLLRIGAVAYVVSALVAAGLEVATQKRILTQTMRSRVEIVRALIEQHMAKEVLRLERFAKEIVLGDKDRFVYFLDKAAELHGAHDVFYLVDAYGVVEHAAQPHQHFIGLDLSHLPFLSNRRTMSRVQQSLFTQRSVTILLTPIGDGRHLVLEKDLGSIVPLVEHFEKGEMIPDEQMFVLSGDGTVAYHPDHELIHARHNLGLEMRDRSAPSDDGLSTFRFPNRRFIDYREALERPPGWTIHYAVPYSLLRDTVIREVIIHFLVLAVVFLLLFRALALLLDRYFSRPVADIVDALKHFDLHGEGEIVPSSSSRNIREFEQIIRSMNSLAENTRRATGRLEEREEMFRTVTENTVNLAFWRRPDGSVRYITPSCERITGYRQEEFYEQTGLLTSILHPEDRSRWLDHTHDLTSSGDVAHLDFRIVTKSGGTRWIRHFCKSIADKDGKLMGYRSSNIDVTEQKEAERQLIHNAFYDGLTGLANRNLLTERLQHAIKRRQRGPSLFAVLYMDLDRFKVINDSLGHQVGDQLLVAVADELKAQSRPGDTIGRLGGDEFVILLENIGTIDDALKFAERIHRRMRGPFLAGNYEVFTTASVGVAMSEPGYDKAEDMLRDADTAMYHAKSNGRDRSEVFDQGMHAEVVARLDLENDLRRAIEREEFVNYYQPILSLQDGRLLGFEALVRWRHPTRGLIGPLEFISLAEETNLILALGEQVLHSACSQIRQWQERVPRKRPLEMSVNLSAVQLSQPSLIETVKNALDENKLPAQTLSLEMTESILMENAGVIRQMLGELRLMGIRLSMDDFGTGYSSLSHLRRFPFNTLKIERSFIRALEHQLQDKRIVHTIIDMAHHLELQVIAEGVETRRQYELLQEMGCDYGQGFLFSPPVEARVAGTFLDRDDWLEQMPERNSSAS